MSDERLDLVLDAWELERRRADAAERRVIIVEGLLSRLLTAVAHTSFVPTPELEAVLEELTADAGVG